MSGREHEQRAVGVVLLDIGGPGGVDEIEPFLRRFLGHPAILPFPGPLRRLAAAAIARGRFKKVSARYRAIGGGSPMDAEVGAMAAALAERLGLPVVHGFLFSAPELGSALDDLVDRGVERVVGVPTFPQRSHTTATACVEALAAAARARGLRWCATPSFPEGEGFLDCLEARARPLLDGADRVLMVAHGLPESHVRRGDPYVDEVCQTAARLAQRLGDLPWSLAFQSRMGPVKWTGPALEEELARLAEDGAGAVALLPISFACENLETLWDLDMEAPKQAADLGIGELRRAAAPGAHPAFVGQLAALVEACVAERGWAEPPAGEGRR